MNEEDTKIEDYLNFIEKRIIEPVDKKDIGESCTATLLLIFAAIDSLSKITCSECEFKQYKDKKKGVGVRFKRFLKVRMDNEYKKYRKEIYSLRNDIVHTGVNAKVILSKDQKNIKHLKKENGHLWINTKQFFNDFTEAFEQIKSDIRNKGTFYLNAKNRLKNFNIIEYDEDKDDVATPSLGPDISVI